MSQHSAARQLVRGVYPQGCPASGNEVPLLLLAPTQTFTRIAEAGRDWTAGIATHSALASTLRPAIAQAAVPRCRALVGIAR